MRVRVPPWALFMSKLAVNSKFFQTWSSDMAYILGFITADGCIGIKSRKEKKFRYFLNITNKDFLHLKNIKETLSSQQKIHSKSNGQSKEKKYYCIQIEDKEICRDLMGLGILPRKTYNLNSVKVLDKYFSDFVRGFFDGDGSAYIYYVNKVPQIKASFVSVSLPFISGLNRRLCLGLDILEKSIHRVKSKGCRMEIYTICFYIDDCKKLYKFMYGSNPSLYLPRKRKIFEKWKSIKRGNYIKRNYPSKIGWRLNQKVFT